MEADESEEDSESQESRPAPAPIAEECEELDVEEHQPSATSPGATAPSSACAPVPGSSSASSGIAALSQPCADDVSFHRRVENMLQDVRSWLSAQHDKVVMALRSQNQELRRVLSENNIDTPPELPLPDLLPDYMDRCERQGKCQAFLSEVCPGERSSPKHAKDGNDSGCFNVRRELRKQDSMGGVARKATFSALKDDHPQTTGRRQSTAGKRLCDVNPKQLRSAKTMPTQRLDGDGGRYPVSVSVNAAPSRKRSVFSAENDLDMDGLRKMRSVSPRPSATGSMMPMGSGGRPRGRMSVQLQLPGDELRPQRSSSARPAAEGRTSMAWDQAPALRAPISAAAEASALGQPGERGMAHTDSSASSKNLSLLLSAGKSPIQSPRGSPNLPVSSSRNEVASGPCDDVASAKEGTSSQPSSASRSTADTAEGVANKRTSPSSCAVARAKAAMTRSASAAALENSTPGRRLSGISTTSSLLSDPDAANVKEGKSASIIYNAWTGEAEQKRASALSNGHLGGRPVEEVGNHGAVEDEEACLERGRREAFVPCGILGKMMGTKESLAEETDDAQDKDAALLSNGASPRETTNGAKSLWRNEMRDMVAKAQSEKKSVKFGGDNSNDAEKKVGDNGHAPEKSGEHGYTRERTSAMSSSSTASSVASTILSRKCSHSVTMEDGIQSEMFEYEDSEMEDEDEFEEEEEDEMQHYWLHPVWMDWNAKGKGYTTRKTATAGIALQQQLFIMEEEQNNDMNCDLLEGGETRIGEFMEPFMIHPNAFKRMLWDMLGCALFCWDAVVIPLQFFNPPKVFFLLMMGWIVRIYWTIDIFVSCFTGTLLLNGNVDLRPEPVVKGYVKGWFFFDFLVVMLDWSELYGGLDEFAIARVGKMIKSVRMLRMIRVLKLMKTVKLPEAVRNWTYYFHSERLTILVGIFRIMVAIVWVTHFFACFWYGIGRPSVDEDPNRDLDNWVDRYGYARAELDYLYSTSFHWSLTQFTGSMEINPTNTVERIFSIVALLFAFVVSAFAVSSITTSMTRLEIITTQQSTQFAKLRQYLLANGISKMLSLRIQRSANREVEEAKLRASEADVELLQLVSEPLRVELHYELNSPALTVHPFFYCYDQVYSAAMRQICHTAIERLSFHRGDMIFSVGEMLEDGKMYFLLSGKLLYLQDEGTQPRTVSPGHWACEGALWTQWHYHGSMRSITDTHLALLDAGKFMKITCGFISRDANPIHYGKEFLKQLNCTPKTYMTDLYDPLGLDLGELASKVLAVAQPVSFFGKMRVMGSTHSNNGFDMMGSTGRQNSVRSANGNFFQRTFGSARNSTSSVQMAPKMSFNQLTVPGAGPGPGGPGGRRLSLQVVPGQVASNGKKRSL